MIVNTLKANQAAVILGISLEKLSDDAVKNAFRTKSKLCHPDVSNEIEQWARISWAKECLLKWLSQNPAPSVEPERKDACRACNGSGRVAVTKGFSRGPTLMCVMCNGSGELPTGGAGIHGRDE